MLFPLYLSLISSSLALERPAPSNHLEEAAPAKLPDIGRETPSAPTVVETNTTEGGMFGWAYSMNTLTIEVIVTGIILVAIVIGYSIFACIAHRNEMKERSKRRAEVQAALRIPNSPLT